MPDPFGGRSEISSEEWQAFLHGDAVETRQDHPGRPIAAPPAHETETRFRDRVVAYATSLGWLAYFTQRSDRSPAGFPDLVLVRGDRTLFRELKVGRGRLSQEQWRWLRALIVAGNDVAVWTPADWGAIVRELA